MQVQHLAERADQQRLAEAGNAFEQGMAAAEEAGQDAVDDLGMADDDLADLVEHRLVCNLELLDLLFELVGGWHAEFLSLASRAP